MDILVVVDMQNDFVSGALGTAEAAAIVSRVVDRVAEGTARGEKLIFTRDTHWADYLDTQEGRRLPVPHCIRGTEGWEIIGELASYAENAVVLDKPTFGSRELGQLLAEEGQVGRSPSSAFARISASSPTRCWPRHFCRRRRMVVEAGCCAGVTPESHRNALAAMEVCQITVKA